VLCSNPVHVLQTCRWGAVAGTCLAGRCILAIAYALVNRMCGTAGSYPLHMPHHALSRSWTHMQPNSRDLCPL
jgi:hypothetical protein